MIRVSIALAAIACLVVSLPTSGQAQQRVLDAAGTYSVTMSGDDGAAIQGTLTLSAANGVYSGHFDSAAVGQPLTVTTAATSGDHVLVVIDTGQGLALVNAQVQSDGSYKGTWHRLADGIAFSMTKAK